MRSRYVLSPWRTYSYVFFFFFQAEDGIRDKLVTGVQTCALPICERPGACLPRDVVPLPRAGRILLERHPADGDGDHRLGVLRNALPPEAGPAPRSHQAESRGGGQRNRVDRRGRVARHLATVAPPRSAAGPLPARRHPLPERLARRRERQRVPGDLRR